MKINLTKPRFWPRRRTTVVAATGRAEVLSLLWQRSDVRVREARTVDGLHALLDEARLVILDPADLLAGRLEISYALAALAQAHIPHTDSAGFLAEPERWLASAAVFAGQVRSLPPRLVAFTSLASGGVGKTTLTLGLAFSVARRTHLPVAIIELAHGASGFLAVLDPARFTAAPVDAYMLATQEVQPAVWRDGPVSLTVVPMDGRQAALLTGESLAVLLARLRASHVLVVADAVQPHPLWPAVDAAAEVIFVMAAADRPDTVVNAQTALAEANDPRQHLVLNLAGNLDRLASRLAADHTQTLVIPRRPAIARYADPLLSLTKIIWPEW